MAKKKKKSGANVALTYIITFILFFAALGGGVYFLLGEYLGLDTIFNKTSSNSQGNISSNTTGLISGYVPDERLSMTILFIGGEGKEGAADSFMLCRYLPQTAEIILVPLPWQMTATVGTKTDTLRGFSETGVQSVVGAVENAVGISVERYVRYESEVFEDFVDTLGSVVFDVPYDISYKVKEGVFINIKSGKQLLDGEAILRLSEYAEYADGEDFRYKLQGLLITELLNTGLQPRLTSILELTYNNIVNTTNTNLSATDFTSREDALVHTIEYGVNPAQFIPPSGEYNDNFTEFKPSSTFKSNIVDKFKLKD